MRSDMAKVIVERPRHKGNAWNKPKGYQRAERAAGDDAPRREGMKDRRQHHTKSFNEHLGPLRRYLDKNVGRPWNLVYSEICANISRNSVVQNHVHTHIEIYVTVNVMLRDGVPCRMDGWGIGSPIRDGWYVCPRTGLLRRLRAPRHRWPRNRPVAPRARYVPLGKSQQCRQLADGWYVIDLAPLPSILSTNTGRDILLDRLARTISPDEAKLEYGAAVYAIGKRRLHPRELPQYPIPYGWRR